MLYLRKHSYNKVESKKMKEKYFSICKCRLCGEIYANEEKNLTLSEVAILILRECKQPHAHFCKDGAIGMADFQGLKP